MHTFQRLLEISSFINDVLRRCNYLDWPVLDTEVSKRVRFSLDSKSDLVVCLYKMKGGTIECIAYIS